MQKLHFSIDINAPKEKVWNTMLEDATYRQWTDAFMPGSHYVGSWEAGSKIQFLAPDESGKQGGLTSTIVENRPYEYISIQHLGLVTNGVEDTTSEEANDWSGALENYTLTETDGTTTLDIDVDSDDENKPMFEQIWPEALKKLKTLAEK